MKHIKKFDEINENIKSVKGTDRFSENIIYFNNQPIGTIISNGKFIFDKNYYEDNVEIGIPREFFIEFAEYLRTV